MASPKQVGYTGRPVVLVAILCAAIALLWGWAAWADTGDGTGGAGGFIGLLGRFHAPAVHFPVALIMMAALAEVLFMKTRNPSFDFTARFMLIAASVFAVPTIVFGFASAKGESFGSVLQFAFEAHRILGVTVGGLVVLTTALAIRTARLGKDRKLYRVLLVITFLCVASVAAYGGKLVYGAH